MEKRHPGILQRYEKYFIEIIEKPDYILKDNIRENTALILKTIYDQVGKILGTVNLVLRLAVEGDSEENKNSIGQDIAQEAISQIEKDNKKETKDKGGEEDVKKTKTTRRKSTKSA